MVKQVGAHGKPVSAECLVCIKMDEVERKRDAIRDELVAALEFYADWRNHMRIPMPFGGEGISKVGADGGERARNALAKANKP